MELDERCRGCSPGYRRLGVGLAEINHRSVRGGQLGTTEAGIVEQRDEGLVAMAEQFLVRGIASA